MSDQSVAQRYAKPLFDLAVEKGILEEVNEDMMLFTQTIEENPLLLLALESPVIRGHKKLNIVKEIFKDKMNPTTLLIFELMCKKSREEILYIMSKSFTEFYYQKNNIEEAEVISATPLEESQVNKIKEILEKQTGKKIMLTAQTQPNLVGGLVLKMQNGLLDYSIKSSLQQLKLKFLNN